MIRQTIHAQQSRMCCVSWNYLGLINDNGEGHLTELDITVVNSVEPNVCVFVFLLEHFEIWMFLLTWKLLLLSWSLMSG